MQPNAPWLAPSTAETRLALPGTPIRGSSDAEGTLGSRRRASGTLYEQSDLVPNPSQQTSAQFVKVQVQVEVKVQVQTRVVLVRACRTGRVS